jgi:formylglycine-generating enzyme required for sulfatase activity
LSRRSEGTRKETEDVHQKVELNLVREDRFQMGIGENKKTVNLTHPIEVISRQVTQKQWVEVMGENPTKEQEGEHSIVVSQNGKSTKMQPDNPVEKRCQAYFADASHSQNTPGTRLLSWLRPLSEYLCYL